MLENKTKATPKTREQSSQIYVLMTLFDLRISTFELLLKRLASEKPKSPINIEAIATSFGLEIVYEPLPCTGCLEKIGPDNYAIRVSDKSSKARQRFTIAHEIAHIALDTSGLNRIVYLLKENFAEEARFIRNWADNERLCDFIAALILVPSHTVRQLSDWKTLSIGRIEKAAKEWLVSKEVLLRRILTLMPFEGGFIWGKTTSKPSDPREIDLYSCRGIFPKSRRVKIPKEMRLHTLSQCLLDLVEEKEKFDQVGFDLDGLKGLRAICAKAYGKGDERSVLMLVYPREVKLKSVLSAKCVRQTLLTLE